MAGAPIPACPLHRYILMDHKFLGVQQMDLHLLKLRSSPNQLLVKPLPEWILSYDFWTDYLCCDIELHRSACGFLVSYAWLITTPLDLKLAHESMLLPSFITWTWWKTFIKVFIRQVDINNLDQVNKRYQFGDLQMERINIIYRWRFFYTHFARGYFLPPKRYTPFFERNFSWALIPFVFLSLILSAMQVGIDLPELQYNHAFLHASYGMVVFSMICALVVVCSVAIRPTTVFISNLVAAIKHARVEQRRRRKLARLADEGAD